MLVRKIKISIFAFIVILLLNGFVFGYVVRIDGTDYDFQYRRPITIQGSKVPGANSNYPFMFNSTEPTGTGLPDDLKQFPTGKVRNADGYDIVFADEAGGDTQYDHEIEYYGPSTGEYIAWVRVDLTGGDQTIYLYYGSTDITDPEPDKDTQHVTSVWSATYDRVWHFSNNSMTSSAGGADANDNGTSDTAGVAAGARLFERSNSDWIDSQFNRDYGMPNPLSFEAWWKAYSYSSTGTRFIIGLLCETEYCLTRLAVRVETGAPDNDFVQFYLRSRDFDNTGWEGVADYSYDPAASIFDNEFHYSVITCDARDDANPKGYYDGQLREDSNNNFDGYVDFDDTSESDIFIGALNQNGGQRTGHFDGIIDEVRFAKVELNGNWIETTFNNLDSPETFYQIGTQQTLVELSHFRATGLNSAILLEWATETELDNAGFNIWRSEEKDGNYIRINPYFIPAQGEAGFGAEYSFTDYDIKNGKIYYYKLEDIDIYGKSTFHGPVSAIPNDIIIIWPPEREVFFSDSGLFSWSSTDNFTFKVEISTDPSFPASGTLSFPEERWTSENSLWLTHREWEMILNKAHASGGQLFWRIRAMSEDSREIYSDRRKLVLKERMAPGNSQRK